MASENGNRSLSSEKDQQKNGKNIERKDKNHGKQINREREKRQRPRRQSTEKIKKNGHDRKREKQK